MKDNTVRLRVLNSTAAEIAMFTGLSLWSMPAQSQTATPVVPVLDQKTTSPKGAQATRSEDIVVTAQKRATFIQDTPISMNAFRGTEVRRADISDVSGLTRLAPDLQMTQVNSFVELSIRGVTSLDTSATGDPALTVDIDGEYINRGVAINAALFDLARVEILRGPQGTLYGRNATGGAINLIAAKPEFSTVSGFITAGYGNYDAKHTEAAINLPVNDKLAFRVSAFHNDHDGYRDNGPAGRGDNADTTAARVSVLAKPTDRFTAYLAGEYVDVDQSGVSQYGVPITTKTQGLVKYTNPTDPSETSLIPSQTIVSQNPSNFPLDTVGFYKSRQYAVRGRLDYDFGPVTLSYIGAYRYIGSSQFNNSDGFAPGEGTHYDVVTPRQNSGTQSHEIRLSSARSSPVIWQTGVFFFRETQDFIQGLYSPNFVAGPFPASPAILFTDYRPNLVTTSKAAFGQATVPIVRDVLSVTGGIRYTQDEKTSDLIVCPLDFASYLSGQDNVVPESATCPGRTDTLQRASGSKLTWTAGIDWHPAPHHLVYAKVSTGYKAGGFDTVGSFGPESLLAYEVGSKNEFLDRRLTFNADAFYYDYKNQQVQVLLDLTGGFITENAGASRTYGLETDTNYQITDDDRVTLTANYLNAKYTNYVGQYGTLSGVSYAANLAGNKPPLSPDFVFAFGYDHTFRIGDVGTITASTLVRYTSSYFLTVRNWAGDKIAGYAKADLGVEYDSPNQSWAVRAYVHNLNNKIVATYAAYIPSPSEYVYEYSEPRTFGFQVTKRF